MYVFEKQNVSSQSRPSRACISSLLFIHILVYSYVKLNKKHLVIVNNHTDTEYVLKTSQVMKRNGNSKILIANMVNFVIDI